MSDAYYEKVLSKLSNCAACYMLSKMVFAERQRLFSAWVMLRRNIAKEGGVGEWVAKTCRFFKENPLKCRVFQQPRYLSLSHDAVRRYEQGF